jgi:hypothetical protein
MLVTILLKVSLVDELYQSITLFIKLFFYSYTKQNYGYK